jgi:hypothetical protein
MIPIDRYWHLLRLDNRGQCRHVPQPQVRDWLQTQLKQWGLSLPQDEKQLQYGLLEWSQRPEADAALALMSLRCYVSHCIRQGCLVVTRRFGSDHGFTSRDLYPYVLDDDGSPVGAYRPLSLKIIEGYKPGNNSLENWAIQLTGNHRDLNQFLLDHGLYRATDWAILNDTDVDRLPRILGEFHTLSGPEVVQAQTLLSQYHQVYRRDRFLQRQGGQGGRCRPPTEAQLHSIDPSQAPAQVLARLQTLAQWLRDYRIYARGGLPQLDPLETAMDAPELEAPAPDETEQLHQDFLQRYRQTLAEGLAAVTAAVLNQYCQRLGRKDPLKPQRFLQALALFHCQGESMGAIARQVGLKTQVQVTRLMALKRLRADIRDALLPRLQADIEATVLTVTSVDRLHTIDRLLRDYLAEVVDDLVQAAESEAQDPKKRIPRSALARQVCESVHHLIP